MLTPINAQPADGTLDGGKAIDGGRGFIIPASLARTYFGDVAVAGKSMKLTGGAERNVVGVCQDFPQNCDFSNVVYLTMSDENAGNRAISTIRLTHAPKAMRGLTKRMLP